MSVRHDDEAALVLAARNGDGDAFTMLFRRWFDPCSDVARRIVHSDDLAAEVAQETFLVAWNQLGDLRDPAAFGGWVLRTARNKALNRLEKERRSRPVDHDQPVLAHLRTEDETEAAVVSELSAADQQELVSAASAVLGEREASVLDLHLRFGMGAPELAEELGVTTNNAHQLLFRMRKKLGGGVRAWVLFAGGDPECEALAASLADSGVVAFGRDAMSVIDRHLPDCEACDQRQGALLAPQALFAGLPVVGLAPTARAAVADALRSAGVPLGPDAALPPAVDDGARPQDSTGPTSAGAAANDSDVDDRHGGNDPAGWRRRRSAIAALVGAVLIILLGGALWWAGGDDPDDLAAVADADPSAGGSSVSTTSASTTSTTAASTTAAVPSAPTPPATAGTAVPTLPAQPGPTPPASPPAAAPPAAPPGSVQPPAAAPSTAAPPVAPPQPAPTTTARPAAPVITSFAATPLGAPGGPCAASPDGPWGTTLSWTSSGATSAAISGVGSGLPPSGSTVVCSLTPSPPPGGWTLLVIGPGGNDSSTAP